DTAPKRFEFATRDVPGEPIGTLPPGGSSLGTTNVARDLVKLGNLLVVASETGDIVAFDVSRTAEATGLKRYALKTKCLQSATRALATDGHNRVFYAGLFGPMWSIKAMRLEDIRAASEPCLDAPAWAEGLPCFDGVQGAVRIAYALGSQDLLNASEWLALGILPFGTPMELSVLTQDEKGRALDLAQFVPKYVPGVADLS